MEGQGDLFEPEYLTYRPCSATETRKHVTERLQPIVDELKRHKANPLAGPLLNIRYSPVSRIWAHPRG